MSNKTINYYNNNAEDYYKGTVSVDMKALYEKFEKHLPPDASILDCGCGSGRDSKHFIDQGYRVSAFDGSEKLCKKAQKYIGQKVKCVDFANASFPEKFDGIWACASLLHVRITELDKIIGKLFMALKKDGVMYLSFKYGEFAGYRNGRYFTDMTEMKFLKLIKDINGLSVIEMWSTKDARKNRGGELWFNATIRRIVGPL